MKTILARFYTSRMSGKQVDKVHFFKLYVQVYMYLCGAYI